MDILCVNFMEKIMSRSATIPTCSSSLLSSASRNQPAVTDDYPPLDLPLRWRDPPDQRPNANVSRESIIRDSAPLQLPLRWRDPPPDRTVRNHAAAVVRDSSQLKQAISRSDLLARPVFHVADCSDFSRHLEPVEQVVDPQSRIEDNLAVPIEKEGQSDPEEVADCSVVHFSDLQSDLEPKEEAVAAIVEPHSRDQISTPHDYSPLPNPQLPPAANQQPIFHASLERSLIEVSPTLIPPPDSLQRDSSAEGEEQVGVDNHALSSRLSVKRECLARYEPAQRPPRPREDRDEDINHHQSTKMSEILHVQSDQFGNQIRAKFWEVVCTDHHINALINGSSKAGKIGKLDEAYGVMQKMVEWFEKLPEFGSAQSSQLISGEFCAQVWDSCKDVSIRNSPFAASLQGTAKLSDLELMHMVAMAADEDFLATVTSLFQYQKLNYPLNVLLCCKLLCPKKDVISWHSIVGALLRKWDIQDAQKLLDEKPNRDIVSCNKLFDGIRSFLCDSSWDNEFFPRAKYDVTINGGLQICGNPKELIRLMNELVGMYRRCKIFDPGGLLIFPTTISLPMMRLNGVELFCCKGRMMQSIF